MPEESLSVDEKPLKRSKTTEGNSSFKSEKTRILALNNSSASSITISFANESASPPSFNHMYGNINILSSSEDSFQILGGHKNTPIRTSIQAQDHVLAERKRRERFAERILSLSALIPKPTKMDKTTVLTDAIDYIQELKERVDILEREAKERNFLEKDKYCSSDVTKEREAKERNFVEKDKYCSSAGAKVVSDGTIANKSLPEIEVNIFGKSLVTKIHSKNEAGLIVKALSQIEKLNLKIISNNNVPFADNTQLISTIISQINGEFNMTAKDVASSLRSAIQEFM